MRDDELYGEYLRAYAHAYLAGRPEPSPPDALTDPASRLARRLVVPAVVESDAQVRLLRSGPRTWATYALLAAARDAAARRRFGRGFLALAHELAGVTAWTASPPAAPVGDAWTTSDARGDVTAAVAARCPPHVTVVPCDARPRTFVIARDEIVVAIPRAIATPAARFAVLHELGHARAALDHGLDLPRAFDEACAAHAARAMEDPDDPWYSPLATAARTRRRYLAAQLAAIEEEPARGPALAASPPWALWHDPGAQAAYVVAEELAATFPAR